MDCHLIIKYTSKWPLKFNVNLNLIYIRLAIQALMFVQKNISVIRDAQNAMLTAQNHLVILENISHIFIETKNSRYLQLWKEVK